MPPPQGLLAPLRAADRSALAVTLVALGAMTAYAYFGMAPFYDRAFGPDPLWRSVYQVLCAFLLLGVVPVAGAFTAGARPADIGFCLGDWRFGLKLVVVAAPLLAPLLYLSMGEADFQAEYPLTRWAAGSSAHFAAWSAVYLVYYVGWETGFRGVLQLWLGARLGDVPAMLVQTAASTLLHIGKPAGETFAALVAGPLFGLAAIRARALWPVLLLHWTIGVLTDLFCLVRSGRW
jgi:membrane protease YdiL (CAAX protease family)